MLYNKSELSNFCKTALMAQGVSEKNAQVTTALLIEADEMGIELPGLELVLSLYEECANRDFENLGTQALYKLYEK